MQSLIFLTYIFQKVPTKSPCGGSDPSSNLGKGRVKAVFLLICDTFSAMYRTDTTQVLSEKYWKAYFEIKAVTSKSIKHS